ncbi:MAG: usg protein [Geminicoccaceae bacterium]
MRRSSPHTPLEMQLKGYRLATAEIVYHLPDHPRLLQTFVWQHYDIAPDYPELRKFLDFWTRSIEGKLHSVTVARRQLIGPAQHTHVDGIWQLH